MPRARGQTLALLVLLGAAVAQAPGQGLRYSKPITISKGGVYRGNWESLDPRVPAVRVETSQPVVIEYANIRSRGPLIISRYRHADLTVRYTRGVALAPGRPLREYRNPGRFVQLEEFRNANIYNNELVGTSGMYFREYNGDPKKGQTVRIRRNRALNIDGRYSTGPGTFSSAQFQVAQFVQFNGVRGLPGADIAWNEVVNEPGKSRVEENISIYLSSGRPGQPIRIHDNYIQGAFSEQPTRLAYSGGGMNLGDGTARTAREAAAHVQADHNQIVNTTTGLALSAGHDIVAFNNRLVSSGYLPGGRPIFGQNVGIYVWDGNGDRKKGTFYNVYARDNLVGWATPRRGKGTQNPFWFPDCAQAAGGQTRCVGNRVIPGPITQGLERAEYARWQAKLRASGVRVGVIGPRP